MPFSGWFAGVAGRRREDVHLAAVLTSKEFDAAVGCACAKVAVRVEGWGLAVHLSRVSLVRGHQYGNVHYRCQL